MLYALFKAVSLCAVVFVFCASRVRFTSNNQERKSMSDNREVPSSGNLYGFDKAGKRVSVEYKKMGLMSVECADAMKSVWEVARKAYVSVEMKFLREYPEVVGAEPYFKPFEPLFERGVQPVDWVKAEQIMEDVLKRHFVYDVLSFSPEILKKFQNDVCWFVTIRDQDAATPCGFITFIAKAGYPQGDVKVMSFAIDPEHQGRGLGKLLMSSIFSCAPDAKRIFLCTRVTNDHALRAYRSWGFVDDAYPILDHAFNLKHWIFMEYKPAQSEQLQIKAAELVS